MAKSKLKYRGINGIKILLMCRFLPLTATRHSSSARLKMAALKQATMFLPAAIQVRCMAKVNIQHPRPPHDARRLFEEITKPIILPKPIPHYEVCAKKRLEKLQTLHESNPYEEFLLHQCKKMLSSNRMVAVCQALPMSARTQQAVKNKILNNGMKLRFFNNGLVRQAVEGTPLTNLKSFMVGNNYLVVSEEPCVPALVKTLRTVPELILLGGLVDNYLLSREGLNRCLKLPELDTMRGELLSILGAPASRTHTLLGNQQQLLSLNLKQYVKQCQENEDVR